MADPTSTASLPAPSPGRRDSRPTRARKVGRLVGGALVLVLAFGVGSALQGRRTTAPGAVDASPVPSSRPTQPSRTDCPLGDPLSHRVAGSPDRVHGGGLSYTPATGWTSGPRAGAFSWAYDVGEADQQVHGTWFTGAAVGALAVSDGAVDARSAAELVAGCTATAFFYPGILGRTDLVKEATTLDDHPAWTIRAEIRMDNPYVDVPGDVLQVTAVDLGSQDSMSFFWADAPIGDEALVAQVDQVASGLGVG